MTPALGAIDLATSYAASTTCRPSVVGDELYFPAESGTAPPCCPTPTTKQSVSETATDVTKHVTRLIPSGVTEIVSDPIQGRVFLLSDATTPDTLYVHTFYYEGETRVQSAWGKYQFDGVTILSMGMVDSVVQLLVEYDSDSVARRAAQPSRTSTRDFTWTPRIDVNQLLTGTYDAGTGLTTWDLGYAATDPAASRRTCSLREQYALPPAHDQRQHRLHAPVTGRHTRDDRGEVQHLRHPQPAVRP
jgi:hypothetical protein